MTSFIYRFAQDYKKLGFNNDLDPTLDFMAVPPGVLALDCMDYFAKNHPDQFTKVNICSMKQVQGR